MSLFADLILHITALLGLVEKNPEKKTASDAIRECDLASRRIRKAMKKSSTMGEKQQLMASLRNVKALRNRIKDELKKGTGLNSKETAKHRVQWDDASSAFESRIRSGLISNLRHKDVRSFFSDSKILFKRRVRNALKNFGSVKVNMIFCGEFILAKANRIQTEFKYFTTSNFPIFEYTDLDEWFVKNIEGPITTQVEEFSNSGSGWTLQKIVNLGVNINKFTPQIGSSYIDLPLEIKRKEAIINIKNNDGACFGWSIVSALHPVESGKNTDKTSSYPHYSGVLKLKGINFPMTIYQIPNFEKQNNISVNVYILKKEKKEFNVLPTFLTRNKREKHVNLLLIQDKYGDSDKSPIRYHYCWIKNLSRLLSKQLSDRNEKKYFCDRCLHYFRSQEKLINHTQLCEKMNNCKIKIPTGDKTILKFKDFKLPFVVYADLESILNKIQQGEKYQLHSPSAIGYYVKCSYDDSLSFYRLYRGENSMEWFANQLIELIEKIETIHNCIYDLNMTVDEKVAFQRATHCHICEKPSLSGEKKVRDHFHLSPNNNNNDNKSSNYRGPAHEECNVNYNDSKVIPVIFHNMSNYDGHFIIEKIATEIQGKIDLLPITKEKYISFSKHVAGSNFHLRFIDSFRFLNSSLNKLSSYLTEFTNLRAQFADLPDEKFELLTKKGVMPYDYFDSFEKYNETRLPSVEHFYNNLNGKKCPRKQYERAQDVWNVFNCETLGEYVDLYMKTDILLLADVFEQFRLSSHKSHGLDPAHSYTLPGYTWMCMLHYTKQELELLTDVDMLMMIESGIRGGLSQICSKRRAKANNRYLPYFNPTETESYLMYFDINNQYGWSMSEALPYGGFEWCDTDTDYLSVPGDSNTGYILEVDLDYPRSLHDKHSDLPFCSEHINPKTGKPASSSSETVKLMATLLPKKKYVIHYRNLKQALTNGLILTKIHRVIKFNQSTWLKSYIDLNTRLRKSAKNEFEKNLFKLLNNAVFGKSVENIRKHSIVKLITKWDGRYGAEALIAKPEFKSVSIFNENLSAIELNKTEIYFNKPIYVGFCILDISKSKIYDFHYNYMQEKFGNDCSVLYTDTDSLIYEIHCTDVYEVIRQDCHNHFDTSDYPKNNIYNIPLVNKKVLEMMKDENNGVPMTDFIGMRSKLYATKIFSPEDGLVELRQKLKEEEYDDDEIQQIISNYGTTRKAKGIKKFVVDTEISFKDYVDCLENSIRKTVRQRLIKSEKNQVFSMEQEKIALSSEDDKRYLCPGSHLTLPMGHYAIPEDEEMMDTDCESRYIHINTSI